MAGDIRAEIDGLRDDSTYVQGLADQLQEAVDATAAVGTFNVGSFGILCAPLVWACVGSMRDGAKDAVQSMHDLMAEFGTALADTSNDYDGFDTTMCTSLIGQGE